MLNFAVQLQEAVRTFIKMQLDAELQSFFFLFSFLTPMLFPISLTISAVSLWGLMHSIINPGITQSSYITLSICAPFLPVSQFTIHHKDIKNKNDFIYLFIVSHVSCIERLFPGMEDASKWAAEVCLKLDCDSVNCGLKFKKKKKWLELLWLV